jgi:hypothetical protein
LASILADIDKALRCSYEAKNKTLEMCSFAWKLFHFCQRQLCATGPLHMQNA